jgi:hypothetical protein
MQENLRTSAQFGDALQRTLGQSKMLAEQPGLQLDVVLPLNHFSHNQEKDRGV